MLSGIASAWFLASDLAIRACCACPWPLPERRPATPQAARLGRSGGSGLRTTYCLGKFETTVSLYGISVRIEQMSKGVFRLNAGSLFLAIQRLERDGLIDGEWKPTENNRRARYYTLTAKGRKRLDSETREWSRQVTAIARILEAS